MFRRIAPALVSAACLFTAGCANVVETRAIKNFTEGLAAANLEALKESTSEDFEQKALRHEEAVDTIRDLKIPVGKPEIVKVEEKDNQKAVTAKLGEKKTQVLFTLVRDADSGKWVVNDVVPKKRKKGDPPPKTVAEQMDLLLCLHEFLDAWEAGDRGQIMSGATPEFASLLSELPAPKLLEVVKHVTSEEVNRTQLQPEAQINEETSLVRVPRRIGEILISYRRVEGHWRVDDVAVSSSRKDGTSIPSLRKMTRAITTAVAFQESYQARDKEQLAALTTREFFEGSLAPSDLSSVPLPDTPLRRGEFELELQSLRADVILRGPENVVKIGLRREGAEQDDAQPRNYRVDDVTIYDLKGGQAMKLSALFTAHAGLRVFVEALAKRDLKLLEHTSTQDFSQRVWNRAGQTLVELPLDDIPPAAPEVLRTAFEGAVTRIHVKQGDRPLTYLLREEAGRMKVDDVEFPALDRPGSLKVNLEIMLPVVELAAAFRSASVDGAPEADADESSAKLKLARESTSQEFSKLVWNRAKAVPQLELDVGQMLLCPLNKVNGEGEQTVLFMGDDRRGAHVTLVRQGERFVVDEVLLIEGPLPEERLELKQHLRKQMNRAG